MVPGTREQTVLNMAAQASERKDDVEEKGERRAEYDC
jgi:hypothetical protein